MDAQISASIFCFVVQSAKKGGFKGERVQKTVFSI